MKKLQFPRCCKKFLRRHKLRKLLNAHVKRTCSSEVVAYIMHNNTQVEVSIDNNYAGCAKKLSLENFVNQ